MRVWVLAEAGIGPHGGESREPELENDMSVAQQAIRNRRKAKLDKRYRRKRSKSTAAQLLRKERRRQRAMKAGRSFGFQKGRH